MNESHDSPWGAHPVYRPVRLIPIAGLVATVAVLVVDHVLFWMVAPVSNAFDVVEAWSGGVIQPTLAGNALRLAVLVGLWFGVFRLRPRDVGLEPAGVGAGLGVLIAGWLAIQAVRAAVTVVAGDELVWSARIEAGRGVWLLGAVIAQVLGTALVEEVVHRGLLMPQLFARLRTSPERRRLGSALVLGGAFFAANHIPMLGSRGYGPIEIAGALVVLTAGGCFFALIYLRTGNLFVVMAVHALGNVAGDVIASPVDGRVLAYALGLGCILWWPRARHVRRATT